MKHALTGIAVMAAILAAITAAGVLIGNIAITLIIATLQGH